MEKSATRVESPLPTPRATRIEDLSPVGDELSEEQLRLVVGARRSNLTFCFDESDPELAGCPRNDQIRDD